jgi:hypothetical protein
MSSGNGTADPEDDSGREDAVRGLRAMIPDPNAAPRNHDERRNPFVSDGFRHNSSL